MGKKSADSRERALIQVRVKEFGEYMEENEGAVIAFAEACLAEAHFVLLQRLSSGPIDIGFLSRRSYYDNYYEEYYETGKLTPLEKERLFFHTLEYDYEEFFSLPDIRDEYDYQTAFYNGVWQALHDDNLNLFDNMLEHIYRDVSPEVEDKIEKTVRDNMRKLVAEYCSDADWKINNDYDETASHELLMLCFEKNPHYHEIVESLRKNSDAEKRKIEKRKEEEQKRILELQNAILQRIPENPKELYPLARTMKRKFILHVGPTNSGKTHEAMQALISAQNGVYLAPLRLLAFEGYERINAAGISCTMITGEEVRETEGAQHVACTIEMAEYGKRYGVAVIDEAQMIADEYRGGNWTAAILGIPADEIHVCMANEAVDIVSKLIAECGDEYTVVQHVRNCPLIPDKDVVAEPEDVRAGDALIVFSRNRVLQVAAALQKKGIACSVLYGALPYEVRREEVRRFAEGETKVVVATDCIGMGMNLPIQRVVFLEIQKFDGKERRRLTPAEFLQIAGRAGRKGFYDTGLYAFSERREQMAVYMKQPVPKIKKARLGFEKMLAGIQKPLSEIMTIWQQMEAKDLYDKNDLSEQIYLCKELERLTDNKTLIFGFIMIPFDSKNDTLKEMWKSMFRMEIRGEHADFVAPDCSDTIEDLELAYKICDLFYYYRYRFCKDEQLEEILREKKEITTRLSRLLAEKNLRQKTCRTCGKPLPWMHNFNECEACYRARTTYQYYDYDDEFDDEYF